MIRFALIVASTLGFVLTAALGNFMAPLLQELERFRPQEQQEPQTPVQSRVPALGGLCLMVSTLAAVGVGWTAACIAQPTLLGSESQLMTRLLIALFGAQAFGAIGLADDAARLRSRAQLGLRRLPRLALEAAAAAVCAMGLAGEIAHQRLIPQDGNATYRNYIIDAIYNMTPEQLEKGANYEVR